VDQLDRGSLYVRQPGALPQQRRALALGIDPPSQLLDLIVIERPLSPEARDRVPATRGLLAVLREHTRSDAEQPGPVRSPARVEPGEAADSPNERLRGEIRDRLWLTTPARKVAHEGIDVAQVDLLEFVKRRPRRASRRPAGRRNR